MKFTPVAKPLPRTVRGELDTHAPSRGGQVRVNFIHEDDQSMIWLFCRVLPSGEFKAGGLYEGLPQGLLDRQSPVRAFLAENRHLQTQASRPELLDEYMQVLVDLLPEIENTTRYRRLS